MTISDDVRNAAETRLVEVLIANPDYWIANRLGAYDPDLASLTISPDAGLVSVVDGTLTLLPTEGHEAAQTLRAPVPINAVALIPLARWLSP